MQSLDISLSQRRACRFYDNIHSTEVVRRLDDVIHRNICRYLANGLRLENPPRLLMGQAASLDVVRVVGKVNLKPMIESSRNASALFSLKQGQDA